MTEFYCDGGEPIKAVDMVRSIREAHYARIKDLSPEEKIRFFREKARALHSELEKPPRSGPDGRTT